MHWKPFAEYPNGSKVTDDTPTTCSICCTTVPASESWGVGGDNGGWMVCPFCHDLYLEEPLAAWTKAQDRWDSVGPCD